ncbi:MAG: hypothetical protein JNM84_27925 [Planctomycetes bacterium]|nr:hypothetical protein [Planctomycetota bacterium]
MSEGGLAESKDREILERLIQDLELAQPHAGANDAAVIRAQTEEALELLRLRLRKDLHEGRPDPLIAVVCGGTNVGKSTVFNGLCGLALAKPTALARGTKLPMVFGSAEHRELVVSERFLAGYARAPLGDPDELNRDLGAASRSFRFRLESSALSPDLLLCDSTDVDSDRESNLRIAHDLLLVSDAVIFVVSPTKYRDAAVVAAMRRAVELGRRLWVVWNPWDEAQADALADFEKQVLGGDLGAVEPSSIRVHKLCGVPGGRPDAVGVELAPLRAELGQQAGERAALRVRGLREAAARVGQIARGVAQRLRDEQAVIQALREAQDRGRVLALEEYASAVRAVLPRTVEEPFRVVWEKTRVPFLDPMMDHAWGLLRKGLWLLGFQAPKNVAVRTESLDERDRADLRTLLQRLVDHVDRSLVHVRDARYLSVIQDLRKKLVERGIDADLGGLAAFATRARREWIDVRVADTLQSLQEQPARYRAIIALRTLLTLVPTILIMWWINAFAAIIFVVPAVHGAMSHLLRRVLLGAYVARHRGALEKAWVAAVGGELEAGWMAQARSALPKGPDPLTIERLEALNQELRSRVEKRATAWLHPAVPAAASAP